jgi:hypothetical protein
MYGTSLLRSWWCEIEGCERGARRREGGGREEGGVYA